MAYALKEQGVAKQMKAATRQGAKAVLLIGPEEVERGCVVVRDMATGEERDIPLSDLA